MVSRDVFPGRQCAGNPAQDAGQSAAAAQSSRRLARELVPRLQRETDGMLGSLSCAEIEELLRTEAVARLGCHAEGRTYVVPVTYAYDGDALLIQSADGLKLRMMRDNPWVCVEVDHIDDLANWRSVIAWGRFGELFGTDASVALARLRERLQPLIISETTPVSEALAEGERRVRSGNGHASIYRIHLFEKTGRFERR